MIPTPRTALKGFTLIEISVVLAVIGLLIGSVFGGMALLNGQKLRKVGTDATTYSVAINQFKLQYEYYPGDFPLAQQLWGRADGGAVTTNCANPAGSTAAGTGTATCNGNGNGVIQGDGNYDSGGGSITTSMGGNSREYLRFWQHLSNSKLISIPRLTGTPSSVLCCVEAGVNLPEHSFEKKAVFSIIAEGNIWNWGLNINNAQAVNQQYWDGDYSNALIFAKVGPKQWFPEVWPDRPVLTPQQLWELDSKLDDGVPPTGMIRTFKPNALTFWINCASDMTTAATYKVDNTDVACPVIFMNGFAVQKTNRQ